MPNDCFDVPSARIFLPPSRGLRGQNPGHTDRLGLSPTMVLDGIAGLDAWRESCAIL
jgi:hypothetical protein